MGNQDRDDQALVRPVCRHPPPAVAPKPHRSSRTPPRPPSRTDSLNPTSKTKGRPQSVVTRSPLPPLLAGRPLSVPAQTSPDLLFPRQPHPLHPSPRRRLTTMSPKSSLRWVSISRGGLATKNDLQPKRRILRRKMKKRREG